jgi:hypothetical protein
MLKAVEEELIIKPVIWPLKVVVPVTSNVSNTPPPPVVVIPVELIVVVEVAKAKTKRKETKTERVMDCALLFLKMAVIFLIAVTFFNYLLL